MSKSQAILVLASLIGIAATISTQEVSHLPGSPPDIGPGTQGDLVYQGPADSCFLWGCDFLAFVPIGEAIEDAHLTKGGLLASFEFTYSTFGSEAEPEVADDLIVIVSFYENDASDSVVPDGSTRIASYTLTGLPRYRSGTVARTIDVAQPGPLIPADVWMGVELVFPPGSESLGSLLFDTSNPACAGTPPTIGTSHAIGWFGVSACDPFSLYDFDPIEPPNPPHDPFSVPPTFVWEVLFPDFPLRDLNYTVAIRVFDAPDNQPPTCTADLDDARDSFLEVAPASFVVTEGETITVDFTGDDPDDDPLSVTGTGLPPGASLGPLSGGAPLTSTFTWTPTAADKAGAPYTVTVTFGDPGGASSSCEVSIADVNLKPVCSASSQEVECTSAAGAPVTLDGSGTDPDDDDSALLYHWDVSNAAVVLDDPESAQPTGIFPIGVTMATLTVADGRGGVAVCDVLITVQDTTPPDVMCTTDVAVLWPPNHQMRAVRLIVTATDACAEPGEVLPISLRVRSDEPDDAPGNGDGSTTGDVDGGDGYSLVPGGGLDVTARLTFDALTQQWQGTIELRAERAGTGNGRKYTIDVQALDSHGNNGEASCCVVVPHDKRRGI